MNGKIPDGQYVNVHKIVPVWCRSTFQLMHWISRSIHLKILEGYDQLYKRIDFFFKIISINLTSISTLIQDQLDLSTRTNFNCCQLEYLMKWSSNYLIKEVQYCKTLLYSVLDKLFHQAIVSMHSPILQSKLVPLILHNHKHWLANFNDFPSLEWYEHLWLFLTFKQW